jgi:predicted dehydrogenase
MNKIKLIHVGLGRWGSDWGRHIYPESPDVEVVGYVDQDPLVLERARAILAVPATRFFPGLSDAIAEADAEAVVITLPLSFHAPVAREALLAGKHVIVEKPFTQTLEEAHKLVDLAEERARVLMVSQNYRYFPAPQAATRFVRDGWLGQLRSVNVTFRHNAPAEGYSYWGLANPLLADMSVHHYDLMRMVIGEEPVELSCRAWNPKGSPFKMAPCAVIVLSFPSGIVASYHGSWLDQGPKTAWAGEWQMDFEFGSVLWASRGDPPHIARRDRMSMRRLNSELEEIELPPMPKHDRVGILAAFAEAIRTGTESQFFPSGSDNLSTLSIVDATLRSSSQGGASVRLETPLPQSGTSSSR